MSETTHADGNGPTQGRAYCGRKARTTTTDWTAVSCTDCNAAHRADETRTQTQQKHAARHI